MKTLEKTGKTVDEAIDAALAELGRSREEVTIEIITMPSKGFLGIGAKNAVVRVSAEDSVTAYAIEFLTTIFKKFELDVEIRAIEGEEFITLDLIGKDLGILIGRRGETLDALQYLTNLTVARHFEDRNKFILDVEGYRAKREETLERLAKKLAERVKESGKNISLEPMSPYERRIIHTILQSDDQVRTFSEGEEPYRKVVIAKKK